MTHLARRDRRADIMHAAEKLFASRRYHEISLDDIVQEAKVGKGTVYRYFRDKDDLFFQTATSGFDELRELLDRQVPSEASFEEQLVSACRHISGFFSRRRRLFRMMQSEDARMHGLRGQMRERWLAHHKEVVSAVSGIVRKGVEEGRIRADVAPEILAAFLLGMLRARAFNLADGEAPTTRGNGKDGRGAEDPWLFEVVVDLFMHGASTRTSESP